MDADYKQAPSPITLLTRNELLGRFFQHCIHEETGLDVKVTALAATGIGPSDLYLIDAGQDDTRQLSALVEQMDSEAPIAMVNIGEEQAECLVERHPNIRGVFYTQSSHPQIMAGIKHLLSGGDWLPRHLTERLLAQWRQMQRLNLASRVNLTDRERQILTMTSHGLSNTEIAEKLQLSPHTIKSHVHNLLRKIGASSRAEAVTLLRSHLDYWPDAGVSA